jgi:hypothetical protein
MGWACSLHLLNFGDEISCKVLTCSDVCTRAYCRLDYKIGISITTEYTEEDGLD